MQKQKKLVSRGLVLLVMAVFITPVTASANQRWQEDQQELIGLVPNDEDFIHLEKYDALTKAKEAEAKEKAEAKAKAEAEARAKAKAEAEAKAKAKAKAKAEEEAKYLSKNEVFKQMNFEMEINKPCGLSKKDFVDLLQNMKYDYTGYFSRNAEFIWEMEQKYQINGLFYCGIAGEESGWGKHYIGNNYTGMVGMRFDTEEEGIEQTFSNLAENYIPKELYTITQIGTKYNPVSSVWPKHVYSAMKMLFD